MTTIQLNEREADLLRTILQGCFKDLEVEIAHTDRKESREYLRSKEPLLRRLIGELEPEAVRK